MLLLGICRFLFFRLSKCPSQEGNITKKSNGNSLIIVIGRIPYIAHLSKPHFFLASLENHTRSNQMYFNGNEKKAKCYFYSSALISLFFSSHHTASQHKTIAQTFALRKFIFYGTTFQIIFDIKSILSMLLILHKNQMCGFKCRQTNFSNYSHMHER